MGSYKKPQIGIANTSSVVNEIIDAMGPVSDIKPKDMTNSCNERN